jgi:hypothetical protein
MIGVLWAFNFDELNISTCAPSGRAKARDFTPWLAMEEISPVSAKCSALTSSSKPKKSYF